MRHVICLLRRPSKAAFFLAGIRRELSWVGRPVAAGSAFCMHFSRGV